MTCSFGLGKKALEKLLLLDKKRRLREDKNYSKQPIREWTCEENKNEWAGRMIYGTGANAVMYSKFA